MSKPGILMRGDILKDGSPDVNALKGVCGLDEVGLIRFHGRAASVLWPA